MHSGFRVSAASNNDKIQGPVRLASFPRPKHPPRRPWGAYRKHFHYGEEKIRERERDLRSVIGREENKCEPCPSDSSRRSCRPHTQPFVPPPRNKNRPGKPRGGFYSPVDSAGGHCPLCFFFSFFFGPLPRWLASYWWRGLIARAVLRLCDALAVCCFGCRALRG